MNITAKITAICLMMINSATAQVQLKSVAELNDAIRNDPKPVLFLLSAEWCSYCHLQKRELKEFFESPTKQFYYVEFDIENKKPVDFNNKNYSYKPNGIQTGIHEFAIFLSGSNEGVSCPSWVLIDNNCNFIFRHAGVLSSRAMTEMMQLLKHYGYLKY
jgi:thioredoxin-related protein